MTTVTTTDDWYLIARDLYWSFVTALPFVESSAHSGELGHELSAELASELRETRDKYERKFS